MISEWEFVARVAVAAFLGGTLGYDRELRRAAAGVRTFALVGMGSAAFIAAAILIGQDIEQGTKAFTDNQVRMAAGLVAGVGFLGAGAILRSGERVHGLTTAASIWVTAAIGLLIGTGNWILGIGVTILAGIIVVALRPIHESLQETDDDTGSHDGSGLG